MKTVSLILCVLLVSNYVFGQDNRLKVFSGYLNEAKSIKDIGISDTKLYVVNSGINSNEEPLFEKQKTANSWTSKNIAGDLNDKTKINTLVSGTFEPANSNREILFIGTTADEVRKYVGGANQTNGSWLSEATSETNLPASFLVNVLHKYKDTGTLNDYVLIGLSGVQDGTTLLKTQMDNSSLVVWDAKKIDGNLNFKLPVVDIIVSEHNSDIIYVAVNDGLGANSEISSYYPNGLTNIPANTKVNGIWWSINGGLNFSKLNLLNRKTLP